jgi:hypothetical protein
MGINPIELQEDLKKFFNYEYNEVTLSTLLKKELESNPH